MKKFLLMTLVAMAVGFLTTTAFAVPNAESAARQQAAANPGAKVAVTSQVPQAQIDMVRKREAMNARRAEMLKMRQQLIDNNSPGNTSGQQKKQ